MVIALAGNQNCGKTTLFNRLTGANQHVGNFPGVTVEQKRGRLRKDYGGEHIEIVDLPGVYSLAPYSAEEEITRDYIVSQPIDVIVNMVDATSMERGLYLTLQLLELNKPLVVALNMMDEVRKNGGAVDTAALSAMLGVPVTPISAAGNEGIGGLMEQALKAARNTRFKQTVQKSPLLESDGLIEKRYAFITSVCEKVSVKPKESREHKRSVKIDKILTGRYTAYPVFLAVMGVVFWLTFDFIGKSASDWLSSCIKAITEKAGVLLSAYGVNPVLRGLITDGIFTGVGAVLSFLPMIITLFFFLSLLEDSGYMARVAFIMDKPLRKIGLSGRSAVPMIIGFGCTVPAVMATRTLPSGRGRKLTMILTPFMSCSAKIPIYAVFAAAFFGNNRALLMFILYLTGITIGIICAVILNLILFKGAPVPFLTELPNYRMPSPRTTLLLMRDKAADFLTRAFTVIFLASVILWFLQSFDCQLRITADVEQSLIAVLGRCAAPLFKPLGFTDWRACAALITGLTAKEAVVSALSVLTGTDVTVNPGALSALFPDFRSMYAFLTFTLLYTPCVAAVAAIKRETRSFKQTALIVLGQCLIAWAAAFLITRPVLPGVSAVVVILVSAVSRFTRSRISTR